MGKTIKGFKGISWAVLSATFGFSPAFATCDTDSPATCAIVGGGATVSLTPAAFSGSCARVTNTGSTSIMVPMLNADAWNSFLTYPHDASISACCTTSYSSCESCYYRVYDTCGGYVDTTDYCCSGGGCGVECQNPSGGSCCT